MIFKIYFDYLCKKLFQNNIDVFPFYRKKNTQLFPHVMLWVWRGTEVYCYKHVGREKEIFL